MGSAVSKERLTSAVGAVISIGSLLSKLPQIRQLFRNRSVEGLSLFMFGAEVFTQAVTILYHARLGLPLSAYGENISLGVSNLAILIAFYLFAPASSGQRERALFCLALPILLLPCIHYPRLLTFLQFVRSPVYAVSRFPQIYSNYINGSTGELNITSYFINFLGSVARIFTTLKQVGADVPLLLSFAISIVLNLALVFQILYYRRTGGGGGARLKAT